MASNHIAEKRSLEVWSTRYGKSLRIVTRRAGRLVDQVSLTSLL